MLSILKRQNEELEKELLKLRKQHDKLARTQESCEAKLKAKDTRIAELEAALRTEATPCLLYTSPSPRDGLLSRMPSSA